jgi:hypothetical protein
MNRRRALALVLVAFAVLIGAGALWVTVASLALEDERSDGGNESERAGCLRLLMGSPEGSLLFSVGSDGQGPAENRVTAFAPDGSMVWDRWGATVNCLEAGPGQGLLLEHKPSEGDGRQNPYTLVRVTADGEQEVARSTGEVFLVHADPQEVVYLETLRDGLGVPSSMVVTLSEGRRPDTIMLGECTVESVGMSGDRLVLAVITTDDQGRHITWFCREPGGAWRIEQQEPTDAWYVSLSADGRQAVLCGPEHQMLIERIRGRSAPLPVESVSEARFGPERLLLLDYRLVDNEEHMVVHTVLLASNEVEWSRPLPVNPTIESDAGVTRLAYIQAGEGGVVVIDLPGRAERVYEVGPVDDLVFIDSNTLHVALRDGSLKCLDVGVTP